MSSTLFGRIFSSVPRFVLALCCAGLAAPAMAADKVRLCLENKVVLPWRTVELAGLNFELLRRVEAKAGVAFSYELLPWKRCLAMLKSNQFDGAFSVSFSEERRQYGVFPGRGVPDPAARMHVSRYFLIRKKGSPITWDGARFHNVDGKIGFQLGYSIGEVLRAMQLPVDESNDSIHNVGRKLLTGRIAAAAMFDSDAEILMRSPLGRKLEKLETPLLEKPYYLVLSTRLVTHQPDLAARIWKTLEEVRNGREYGKLVQAAGAENAR